MGKRKKENKSVKKYSEILYRVIVNGKWGWMEKGNSNIHRTYIGETKNNLPEGFGILFRFGKKEYSGRWLLGEKHGYGIENTSDKCIVKGYWKNGEYWDTTSYPGDWCNHQYGYRNGIIVK